MTVRAPASRYRPVQGLLRGLSILRALNRQPAGKLPITRIAAETGLHRTTVKRLLETLQQEGYVRRDASDNAFCLTLRVRDLSEGFTEKEWITDIAAPAMHRLLQVVQWPSDLTTLDGGAMLIRESTHRSSPLSFRKAMIGQRMPLLFSASGKAYLTACDDTRRRELMEVMLAEGGEQAALAERPRAVRNIVQRVQSLGYASNSGEWIQDSKTHAIALPIMHHGRPLACLNIVFLRKAKTIPQAAQDHLPALRQAVTEIETALQAVTTAG